MYVILETAIVYKYFDYFYVCSLGIMLLNSIHPPIIFFLINKVLLHPTPFY